MMRRSSRHTKRCATTQRRGYVHAREGGRRTSSMGRRTSSKPQRRAARAQKCIARRRGAVRGAARTARSTRRTALAMTERQPHQDGLWRGQGHTGGGAGLRAARAGPCRPRWQRAAAPRAPTRPRQAGSSPGAMSEKERDEKGGEGELTSADSTTSTGRASSATASYAGVDEEARARVAWGGRRARRRALEWGELGRAVGESIASWAVPSEKTNRNSVTRGSGEKYRVHYCLRPLHLVGCWGRKCQAGRGGAAGLIWPGGLGRGEPAHFAGRGRGSSARWADCGGRERLCWGKHERRAGWAARGQGRWRVRWAKQP
jgi:hypothetical protein